MQSVFIFDKSTVVEIIKDESLKIRRANDELFKPNGIRLSNKSLSWFLGEAILR